MVRSSARLKWETLLRILLLGNNFSFCHSLNIWQKLSTKLVHRCDTFFHGDYRSLGIIVTIIPFNPYYNL